MATGESARRGHPLVALGRAGLAAFAGALAITVAWQSATLFRLDLAFTATETELSFWGRDGYQPTDAARARIGKELDTLLERAPAHPDYLALAAYHHTWQAYREDDPTIAQVYALQAVNAQFAAQQNRPAYRQGWAKMVGYARRAGSDEGSAALVLLAQQRLDVLESAVAEAPPAGRRR
jgi:hypothetical protein